MNNLTEDLLSAISIDNVNDFKLLTDKNTSFNPIETYYRSLEKGAFNIVKFILNNYSIPEKELGYALVWGTFFHNLNFIQYIININSNTNYENYYALNLASKVGNIEILDYLLLHIDSNDLQKVQEICLLEAIKNGQLNVVKHLDNKGVDFSFNSHLPLYTCIEKNQINILYYIFENKNYDPNIALQSLFITDDIKNLIFKYIEIKTIKESLDNNLTKKNDATIKTKI